MSFFRSRVSLSNGYFYIVHSYPEHTGWTHIVLNYIGPNDGIRMFINGTEVVSDTTKTVRSYSTGDGRIVVGRFSTNQDRNYASVMVDELIYFNASLTSDDVESIYYST